MGVSCTKGGRLSEARHLLSTILVQKSNAHQRTPKEMRINTEDIHRITNAVRTANRPVRLVLNALLIAKNTEKAIASITKQIAEAMTLETTYSLLIPCLIPSSVSSKALLFWESEIL